MKILMLTPYLPYPPASGGQIRTLNLLKYLSKNNEITLVALYKSQKEQKYLSHLRKYCKSIYLCKRAEKPWQAKNIFRAIFSRYPFLIVRNYSKEAGGVIRNLLRKSPPDVIHAETFYIMPHLPETPIPFVLVEQTIEYKVYQHFVNSIPFFLRPLFHVDIDKLKFWERYYWKKAQVVGTVSHADYRVIKELEPEINPVIIPNGAGDEMLVDKLKDKSLKNPVLLFVGNFYWLQNTEAASYLIQKIFPKIIKLRPDIKLIIAGQNAKNKIKLNSEKNVEIKDINPADSKTIKKLYQEASLFIAPIFGPGGTRLKILAAMATGLPIISTKVGVEGLDVEDGKHVFIANDEDQFVQKIQKALSKKTTYNTLRTASYNLVKEKYNWRAISYKLEVVYKQIISKNKL